MVYTPMVKPRDKEGIFACLMYVYLKVGMAKMKWGHSVLVTTKQRLLTIISVVWAEGSIFLDVRMKVN